MKQLTADSNIVSTGELTLSVPPGAVPSNFKVGLTAVTATQFMASAPEKLAAARAALPLYLSPVSSIYLITTEGELPAQLSLALTANGNMGDPATLDVYMWDGESWKFLPFSHNGDRLVASTSPVPIAVGAFQTASTVQVTSTTLEVGDTLGDIGSAINVVQVTGLTLQADGTLIGSLAGGFTPGAGYAVMPRIRTPDDSGAALNAMLADANAQRNLIGGLLDLISSGGYNGVVLHFTGLDPARGPAFSKFVLDLGLALREQNKMVGVVAPLPVVVNGEYSTLGYDLRSLGDAADMIELPLGDDLKAIGNGTADQIISWAVGEVSRYKLRLATSALSADAVNNVVTRIPATQALVPFGNAVLNTDLALIAPGAEVSVSLDGKVKSLEFDSQALATRFTYDDDSGTEHSVYFVTPETLAHQLALSQKYHLGGVAVYKLFDPGNPPGMLDMLVQFKVNNLALTTNGAALSYTVRDANGVLTQVTAAPGDPFVWAAGNPGNYSIAAGLGLSNVVELGAVDVTVPEVTAAPTGTSSPTPRPTVIIPTATPCSGPCPTAVPAPTKAPTQAAVNVSGGGAWGPVALGGQVVHGGITYAADMKRAGMTWVKLQAHSGNDMSAAINNAHAQGFKILISVVGDMGNVMNPSYQQSYASYLATLASQGADAVEVWNEPNITREWPNGSIGGANYAALLKTVYPVVKAANPNTIVISAAPAPTGGFGGACTGNGCDDKPFMEQLFAAGGANYMDCIGIHYNEAIVSPREIGTDPRDNHYTRYYQTMINTYAAAFQNSRPLCFTELGILTPEGYPDLASTAPSFAWAAGNTVAEQAQWLAEAYQIAKGSSAIRLIIVFNVDFTSYGSDPQGGYAIIRPGGSCPACDALGAVR